MNRFHVRFLSLSGAGSIPASFKMFATPRVFADHAPLDGPHSDSEGRPMDSGCRRQPTEHTRRIRIRTGELLP
jgi:hypothetical protein